MLAFFFYNSAFSSDTVTSTFNKKFVNDVPQKVAVFPQHADDNDEAELVGMVTSTLMDDFKFDVVERESLNLLFNEYKLSSGGYLENKDVEQLKLHNIGGIIIVSRSEQPYKKIEKNVFDKKNYYSSYAITKASVKIIDVTSASIIYQFNYQCDTGKMSASGISLSSCKSDNQTISKYFAGDISNKAKDLNLKFRK